jgi:hypothetical protein
MKGGFMNTEPYILDLSITLLLDIDEENIPDIYKTVCFLKGKGQEKVRNIIFPEPKKALDDTYKRKWELYNYVIDIMCENALKGVVLNRESLIFGHLFELFREQRCDVYVVYNGELRLLA